MKTKPIALGGCLAAVLAACSLPVHAAPTWEVEFEFDIVGYESSIGVNDPFIVDLRTNGSGMQGGTDSGGDWVGSDYQYQSPRGTVFALSTQVASVSNTTLRTRAGIEGVLTPVLISGPTCFPNSSVPGGVTCFNAPLVDGNWQQFTFSSSTTARINDAVIASHPTQTVGGFRLVFSIDGTDTRYLDTFQADATIGGTGGGYELGYMLNSTFLNAQAGETLYDGTYRLEGSDLPLNFNPALPMTDTQRGRTVVSPYIPVIGGQSAPISLELTSLVKIELTNLDAGRVVFLVESDYGSTVHVGFEVYDTGGVLLPDAVVTGLDGDSYTVMTAAVPEPETYALMLAGLGLVGFAVRRRSASAI